MPLQKTVVPVPYAVGSPTGSHSPFHPGGIDEQFGPAAVKEQDAARIERDSKSWKLVFAAPCRHCRMNLRQPPRGQPWIRST